MYPLLTIWNKQIEHFRMLRLGIFERQFLKYICKEDFVVFADERLVATIEQYLYQQM